MEKEISDILKDTTLDDEQKSKKIAELTDKEAEEKATKYTKDAVDRRKLEAEEKAKKLELEKVENEKSTGDRLANIEKSLEEQKEQKEKQEKEQLEKTYKEKYGDDLDKAIEYHNKGLGEQEIDVLLGKGNDGKIINLDPKKKKDEEAPKNDDHTSTNSGKGYDANGKPVLTENTNGFT